MGVSDDELGARCSACNRSCSLHSHPSGEGSRWAVDKAKRSGTKAEEGTI